MVEESQSEKFNDCPDPNIYIRSGTVDLREGEQDNQPATYEILNLSKKELGNLNPAILENQFVLNVKSTGEGKTYFIHKGIEHFVVEQNKKILIIMHQHDNIEEFIRRYFPTWFAPLKNVRHVHFKGRDQPGMCLHEEVERISIECDNCIYKGECNYQLQWQVGFQDNIKIYFAVPQQIFKIYNLYNNPKRVEDHKGIEALFLDETVSNLIYNNFAIKKQLRLQIMASTVPIDCPCNSKLCDDKTKRLYEKYGHCGIFVPKGKLNTDFEVEELDDYYLKNNLNNYSPEHMRIIYGRNSAGLYEVQGVGEKSIHFIVKMSTIIYTDAHANIEEVEDYIGRKIDILIKDEISIKNEVWLMNENMTVEHTKKSLSYIHAYLWFLKVPLTPDTLVVCKRNFLKTIRKLLGEKVRMTHYGNLTSASNKFKDCKNVVLFGRLEPKQQQKNALSDLGKEKQSIEEIGLREELQALGRIRFFDDPDKKLYVFTDTVKQNIEERMEDKNKLHVFRERELLIALHVLSKKEELNGLTIMQVYKFLQSSHNTIRPAFKKLLIPLKYCNDIYDKKKGECLKWT